MYRIVMIYDGEEDEQDEVFETEEAAEEYALYLCGCADSGTEIMHMSNPGDYSDIPPETDYEIIEVDN